MTMAELETIVKDIAGQVEKYPFDAWVSPQPIACNQQAYGMHLITTIAGRVGDEDKAQVCNTMINQLNLIIDALGEIRDRPVHY